MSLPPRSAHLAPLHPVLCSLWQRVRSYFEPSVPGTTLVNDGRCAKMTCGSCRALLARRPAAGASRWTCVSCRSGSTTCHPRPPRDPATEKVLEHPSEPPAMFPVLLRSVFLALGIWAAWTAAASDPTLPLGACLAFAAWKIYDKRSKRSPGGWQPCLAM